MKELTKGLLTGLSLLLPVVLSLYILIWLVGTIESWLRPALQLLLPHSWYFPGMAIASFLLLALLTGLSFNMRSVRPFWKIGNRILNRIPVLNYLYSTIKDFFDLLGGHSFQEQSVVWVNMPGSPYRLLGIVTKQGNDGESRLGQMINDDEVAVYLPMSYQVGGYMVVLPREQVESIEMDPGDALRLIMSAGLGQRKKKEVV
jgi:uncharacterized membrane protein